MKYYIDHNTRTTSWVHPSSPAPAANGFLSPRNISPFHPLAQPDLRAGAVGPASVTNLRG